MKLHIKYTSVSHIHSHATITNLDKWVKVSMTNPNIAPPQKNHHPSTQIYGPSHT